MLRELSETMVAFWDQGEYQRDHEAFREWQRRNKYGYVLNVLPDQLRVFHNSGCLHIRDHSDPNFSLTMKRRLCSTDARELITLAGQPSVDWERCDTCGRKSHDQL